MVESATLELVSVPVKPILAVVNVTNVKRANTTIPIVIAISVRLFEMIDFRV